MESKLNVKLLSHTPNPDEIVACAAKLCYSPVGVGQIQEKLTEAEIKKFVNNLVKIGHESPIEHVSFTFAIEGISRSCSHQIVRHRIASFSQQSQRYVKLDEFQYIIPPEIEGLPDAKKRYIESMEESQQAYNEIYCLLINKYLKKEKIAQKYETEIKNNEITLEEYVYNNDEKLYSKIEKMVIEDCRYVFPNACETKMVFTINARSLINFLNHRCCERAQWEIRYLAIEMLRQLRNVAPILFSNAGPKCLAKPCPEGTMTCGRREEIKIKFENL